MKIYKITNIATDKVYIGKTVRKIERRLYEHFYEAKRRQGGTKLYNSILKHGEEKFTIEVLHSNIKNKEDLNKKEIQVIADLNTIENGYNTTTGGDGGYSQKSVDKCSISIRCLNSDRIYKNSRKAAEDLNLNYKSIWKVCNGLAASTKGFVFEYEAGNLDDILDFRIKRWAIKDIKRSHVYDLKTKIRYNSIRKAAIATRISAGTIKNHCEKNLIKTEYRFVYNNIKKSLIIGDWHCQYNNLKDSEKLLSFIIEMVEDSNIDSIIFMGDLFNTHAIIDLRVQDFWHRGFKKLSVLCPIYILIGNHDMKGDKETEAHEMNSMMVFNKERKNSSDLLYNIHIIDSPSDIEGLAMMPYYKNHNKFIKDSECLYKQGCTNTLMAHQNFTIELFGDMIDRSKVPQKNIISGHIHDTKESKDSVFYTDIPMWLTSTDANKDKGMWVLDFDELKSVKGKEFISTANIVTPIVKIVVNEGDEEPTLDPNARNYLEFHGKTAWISKMKKKYKGKASIKAKPVDRKMTKLDVDKSLTLVDYLNDHFQPIDGVERSDINTYLKDLG